MEGLTITFVGSGNVAHALASGLYASGYNINTIISKNRETASSLAKITGASSSNSLIVPGNTDMVIIAVSDDAISEVLSELSFNSSPIVVHTSGSTDLSVFPKELDKHGVIYPLQTFTRDRKINLSDIHIFTEASDEDSLEVIDRVAASMTKLIHHINSDQRRVLHLSAVFVSNFVNHMLAAGYESALRGGIDPAVFEPLIKETIDKALILGPERAQTGPAVRNDIRIIKKHIELLSFSDDLKNLYTMVSESIIKKSEKK